MGANTSSTTLTLTLIEIWKRPLNSVASSVFGAYHSFVILRLSDNSYLQLEKNHDGSCQIQGLTRREILDLALKKADKTSGYKKHCTASLSGLSLQKNMTLDVVKSIVDEHRGTYEIHESNCHRLSCDVWKAVVVKSKVMDAPMQQNLSKVASVLGVARVIRNDADRE